MLAVVCDDVRHYKNVKLHVLLYHFCITIYNEHCIIYFLVIRSNRDEFLYLYTFRSAIDSQEMN